MKLDILGEKSDNKRDKYLDMMEQILANRKTPVFFMISII